MSMSCGVWLGVRWEGQSLISQLLMLQAERNCALGLTPCPPENHPSVPLLQQVPSSGAGRTAAGHPNPQVLHHWRTGLGLGRAGLGSGHLMRQCALGQ